MFTGIIHYLGTVERLDVQSGILLVRPKRSLRVAAGASIAVNGICLTVERVTRGVLSFTVMPETLRVTTLGGLEKGDRVNLERSLRYGDFMDGHFVMGHVDGVGRIATVREIGSRGRRDPISEVARVVTVSVPRTFTRFVARKGSITFDGVSLTVVSIRGALCTVSLTPYTLKETTWGIRRVGDPVNIEIDVFARYARSPSPARRGQG